MTTIYQMPKVSRRAKVSAPAPLKTQPENRSNNNNNCNVLNVPVIHSRLPTAEIITNSEKKENIVISRRGRGSSRALKLEKPQPLKASQVKAKHSNSTEVAVCEEVNGVEIEAERILSPDSARSTANRIIQEALHNMPDENPPLDTRNRTKLLSQVSRDSGFEESGSFSRQGSILNSLKESALDDSVFDEMINDSFDVDHKLYLEKDRMIPNGAYRSLTDEDLEMIEAELECMRDRSADCEEKLCSPVEQTKDIRSNEVMLMRDPISPLTMLDDIQDIELNMPRGHYTAKGRRRMFRYHKMVLQETADTSKHVAMRLWVYHTSEIYKSASLGTIVPTPVVLQYSVEDLLRIGSRCVDHSAPESWSYMMHVIPEVCLKQSLRFDTLHYLEERSYVEEHIGYIRESNVDINSQKQRSSSSGDVNLDSKCDVKVRGGSTMRSISYSGPSISISVEGRGNTRWVPNMALTETQEVVDRGNTRWVPNIAVIEKQEVVDRGSTRWVPNMAVTEKGEKCPW